MSILYCTVRKMKYLQSVVLLSLAHVALLVCAGENILVETNNGKFEGVVVTTEAGLKINNFLGIKYGIIPKRFSKPLPVQPSKDVVVANAAPPRCIQSMIFGDSPVLPTDTEDCLFLNVFAPYAKVADGYPVMVYIHGGGYAEGYSIDGYTMDGINEWIVPKGVILVNFNYRLGAWGFFSTGSKEAKGNWGLWDQSLLLHWVQDNIKYFGGNPNKVTVFGESAGSISTSLQSVSPHSRNLFHQSILMSASGLTPWFTGEDTVNVSLHYANIVGCGSLNMEQTVSCMRLKSTSELTDGFKQLKQEGVIFHGFTPRVDNDFLPKSVEELILESPPKPFIIGSTKDEMGMFITPFSPEVNTQWTIKDPTSFRLSQLRKYMNDVFVDLKYTDPELLTDIALFHYVDIVGSQKNGTLLTEAYSKFLGDLALYATTMNETKLWRKRGSKVWLYRFDYFNPKLAPGAFHYYDLWYYFKILLHRPSEYTQEELQVADYYTTLFTNFAKFGNPTATAVGGIEWQPINDENPEQFLKIDRNLEVNRYWNRHAEAFWNGLVPLLNSRCTRPKEENTEIIFNNDDYDKLMKEEL